MKIIPIANNHIALILDNGEVLDINDCTAPKYGGQVSIRLERPTERRMIVSTNATHYDGIVRLLLE